MADGVAERDGAPDVAAIRADACGTLDPTALRFLDAIRFAVPADGNVVVDMCIPGYWLAGFYTPAAPRRLQVPLGWGTLGLRVPGRVGRRAVRHGPDGRLISGDGGFLFACGELATMAQEKIPLTAVIVDDGGYGMLRYDQELSGAETYGVDLHTPDFVAMAESFGVRAEAVDGLDDAFGEALARHVADDSPSVLVARTPVPLVPAAEHVAELVPQANCAGEGGGVTAPVAGSANAPATHPRCAVAGDRGVRTGGTPGRPAAPRGPSGPSGACPRSPSSSTASG